MTIKAGSVVQLKSGGPWMTVGEVDGKGAEREAACIWHPKVNGEWIIDSAEETIPLSMLEEVNQAARPSATEDDHEEAGQFFVSENVLRKVEAERDALRAAGLAVCDSLLSEDLDPADFERLDALNTLCTKAVA